MVESLFRCSHFMWRPARKGWVYNLEGEPYLESIDKVRPIYVHLSIVYVAINSSRFRSSPRMTTSQKYRFPTADTDEVEKQRVKNVEESVRQEVSPGFIIVGLEQLLTHTYDHTFGRCLTSTGGKDCRAFIYAHATSERSTWALKAQASNSIAHS